jgi:hypothetical protein
VPRNSAQFWRAILARNSGAQFRLTPPPLLARAQGDGPTTPAVVREYEKRMTHYKRMYVTLQVRATLAQFCAILAQLF